MIYSLILNGNLMGPIKALHSPSSYLKSAGASPLLWRQMHLKAGQTALRPHCLPPSLLPLTSQACAGLLTLPKIVGAASLSKLWGRKAVVGAGEGGVLLLRERRAKEAIWEWTRIFWAQKYAKGGALMEENSSFQFSSREK